LCVSRTQSRHVKSDTRIDDNVHQDISSDIHETADPRGVQKPLSDKRHRVISDTNVSHKSTAHGESNKQVYEKHYKASTDNNHSRESTARRGSEKYCKAYNDNNDNHESTARRGTNKQVYEKHYKAPTAKNDSHESSANKQTYEKHYKAPNSNVHHDYTSNCRESAHKQTEKCKVANDNGSSHKSTACESAHKQQPEEHNTVIQSSFEKVKMLLEFSVTVVLVFISVIITELCDRTFGYKL